MVFINESYYTNFTAVPKASTSAAPCITEDDAYKNYNMAKEMPKQYIK